MRLLAELLLSRLGFRSLAAHLEPSAATFGAGASAACVVDIGPDLTTVACVSAYCFFIIFDNELCCNVIHCIVAFSPQPSMLQQIVTTKQFLTICLRVGPHHQHMTSHSTHPLQPTLTNTHPH